MWLCAWNWFGLQLTKAADCSKAKTCDVDIVCFMSSNVVTCITVLFYDF